MSAPLYPDSLIDRALDQVTAAASLSVTISCTKREKARAEMIRIRDSAGPRQGTEPSAEDLQWALNLRANDLLGLSPESGFYLPPSERKDAR